MASVFSHIVQKRSSYVSEDVATDALAYILGSSESSCHGMMKILRGMIPDLPQLHFKTQQTEGVIRPDMWGYANSDPRVFVENKFWAGLTDSQPVSYLKQLADYPQPTILLVIAPAAREQTLWRELTRRLSDAGISKTQGGSAACVAFSAPTGLGPILALTSWTSVLSALEHEAMNEPVTRSDLLQLRALCNAADDEAFSPVSRAELSDQRTPGFILHLSSIIQLLVDCAITKNVLSINGLRPQASWGRIGRYIWLPSDRQVGAWLGVHFDLWRKHGETPLWLLFPPGDFGRSQEVRPLLQDLAAKNDMLTVDYEDNIAIALRIPTAEEQSAVVQSLIDDLMSIGAVLRDLPPRLVPNVEPVQDDAIVE